MILIQYRYKHWFPDRSTVQAQGGALRGIGNLIDKFVLHAKAQLLLFHRQSEEYYARTTEPTISVRANQNFLGLLASDLSPRFLSITPKGKVPHAHWVFREAFKEYELLDELIAQLDTGIKGTGYIPRQEQIVDASIVAAPRQRMRNSRQDLGNL